MIEITIAAGMIYVQSFALVLDAQLDPPWVRRGIETRKYPLKCQQKPKTWFTG